MKNRKHLVLAGGLVAGLAAGHASAAELGYTYTLTSGSGAVGGVAGSFDTFLNDGVYSADQADAAVAWDGVTGVGVLLNNDVVVDIDLGSAQVLDSVVIDYQVWWTANVPAWESVDVSVDGTFVTTYLFPVDMTTDADYTESIDLTGNTGQMIQLEFTRSSNGGAIEWGPLSEIDVIAVPEPGSLALLGLGGLLIARRRRS